MPTLLDREAIQRARKLCKAMTDGEKRLWHELKTFRRHYGIHVRKQVPVGPYVADFAVHSARLVIEVDGEFHQQPDRLMRDRVRDAWFNGAGYKVLRINTGDLEAAFDGCIEEILHVLGLRH